MTCCLRSRHKNGTRNRRPTILTGSSALEYPRIGPVPRASRRPKADGYRCVLFWLKRCRAAVQPTMRPSARQAHRPGAFSSEWAAKQHRARAVGARQPIRIFRFLSISVSRPPRYSNDISPVWASAALAMDCTPPFLTVAPKRFGRFCLQAPRKQP